MLSLVPVAQWIEHWSPEPVAQVQFLSGTLSRAQGIPGLFIFGPTLSIAELEKPFADLSYDITS